MSGCRRNKGTSVSLTTATGGYAGTGHCGEACYHLWVAVGRLGEFGDREARDTRCTPGIWVRGSALGIGRNQRSTSA
ncbi:MAG: hypothetical protein OXI83_12970, partial [Gemmatimonadota bacterium]|nr:hypothetical protein [Gemmatimonadota bacterium]